MMQNCWYHRDLRVPRVVRRRKSRRNRGDQGFLVEGRAW